MGLPPTPSLVLRRLLTLALATSDVLAYGWPACRSFTASRMMVVVCHVEQEFRQVSQYHHDELRLLS